ncbi:MAG TPA: response regulator, partial [Terracidiphilus sp.]|nr:response regulator [Terracidiphilus sp.]
LGLTISHRIVEAFGGTLGVESQPGQGSTFHFRISLEADDAFPVGESAPIPEALAGLRVLIVDDNESHRRILQDMLRSWKLRPSAVADAESALSGLEESNSSEPPFELLLIDADLPGVDGFVLAKRLKSQPRWFAACVMMLRSNTLNAGIAECARLGLSYLVKPIRRPDLLQKILSLRGRCSDAPAERTHLALRPPSRSLRILLAEDNPINQHLACEILHQQGHSVEVAFNGRQAVQAAEAALFDVLLMDIQMPDMDGFEATAEIRRREQSSGAHLPILALTAHAMSGDRERCFAAGMNGYLAKPISPRDLLNALGPYCGATAPRPVADSSPTTTAGGSQDDVLDVAEALARAGGSKELLQRLGKLFQQNWPAMLADIKASVTSRDAAAVQRSAHTLKGSASVICARATAAAAQHLEMIAKQGRTDGLDAELEGLSRELNRLQPALERLQKTSL